MKGNELLQKMDAKVWAEEFVKLHGGDEGLMLSWFANAIMCGHDHAGSKVEKQARAEVLASYQRAIVEWRNGYGAMPEDSPVFLVATKLLDIITTLQPAAKDLEELLREAELTGRIYQHKHQCEICSSKEPIRHAVTNEVVMCSEFAELEKARTSEEKP